MAGEVTAVLEVGTTRIRCLLGEMREDGSVLVVSRVETGSRGIRKGEIANRDEAISSVRKALKAAEADFRKSIHLVVLVMSGGETCSKRSTGVHRIADPEDNRAQEVLPQDVHDVVAAASKVVLPENRIRLHTVQQFFKVDDINNVVDPLGMACEELRVDVLTIHGKRSAVDNFQKLIADIPIACADAVFSGLGAAMAVADDALKQVGVLVLDLGGGTTDYLLYHEGMVQTCGSFAVGGNHITNDIAVGLHIPRRQAEELKTKEGSALSNLMERDRSISIPSVSRGFNGKIVRALTLNAIIQERMDEIFMLVKGEIDRTCPNVPLGGGVLLTGGGAHLRGARDLGQKVFNVQCSFGKPFDVHGLPSSQSGPDYASLIGAVRYAETLEKQAGPPSRWKRFLRMVWGRDDG